jgi:DNA-binding NtrC family response regulator
MKGTKLLVVDDDELFQKSICKELAKTGCHVRAAGTGEQALAEIASSVPDVVLLDIRLPDQDGVDVLRAIKARDASIEVVMLTAFGSIGNAVQCMRHGAFHYAIKPAKLAEIESLVKNASEKRKLAIENRSLKERLAHCCNHAIVGSSQAITQLMAIVDKVAKVDQTVLIQGESGTGKEVIARRIHELSPRRNRPFVVVDCASLATGLLESELFGHEKGAFTGAVGVKQGLFEKADKGTVFVDEVNALETDVQAKFLRLLEAQEYRRVGATNTRRADVRILAASNSDLSSAVATGKFREDLYFRLSVIVLSVPPLRERSEDIPLLARYFLDALNPHKRLSDSAVELLCRHHWPGNVRELRNVIERAAVLSDGDTVQVSDLRLSPEGMQDSFQRLTLEQDLIPLRELQNRYIDLVLEKVHGHQLKAAEILEVDPKTLYRRRRKQ